jgi:hypothetical protein
MATSFWCGWLPRAAALFGLSLLTAACARGAPDAAVASGARSLHCGRAELESTLNRETPKVREYVVACNFMYTRVQCSDGGCRPAAVEPPCIGKKDCFEEDPVTLEWKPPAALAHAETTR